LGRDEKSFLGEPQRQGQEEVVILRVKEESLKVRERNGLQLGSARRLRIQTWTREKSLGELKKFAITPFVRKSLSEEQRFFSRE